MSRTHEALRRAEANLKKKNLQETHSEKNGQIQSIEQLETQRLLTQKLEARLTDLGLSEDQILNQNLKEIGLSLNQINKCIASPKSSLNIQIENPEADFSKDFMPILIERNKLILNRFDELLSKKKYQNINKLLNKITDQGIKTSLEKNINALYLKDKILTKEYQKLEQLRLTIYREPQPNLNQVSQEVDEKRETPKKSRRLRKFLGILLIGTLLILLTFFIALAPFLDIQVPNILNIAFFILLGFFFGLTIARLAKS